MRRTAGKAGALAVLLTGAFLAIVAGARAARSDAGDGLALYAKNCSSCHGESGRGDGPSGLILKQKPSDLRSSRLTDDEIFDRITEGKAPMPAFGKRLSAEDRRTLVRYVRELAASGH